MQRSPQNTAPPSVTRRRAAEFVANLVVFDEPHVVAMKAGKSHVIAVAIPPNIIPNADFIAATVTSKNWQRYLEGYLDLRYLFTYPFQRRLFSFPNAAWNEEKVMLTPIEGEVQDSILPQPGFFSRDHTEAFDMGDRASGKEKLYIDGEWDLDEFGSFYQKYSDVYSFLAVVTNYTDPNVTKALKGRSESALKKRPYKGGSSYLHVFNDLDGCLPNNQKLGLDGIVYNSPGDVRINGEQKHLANLEAAVSAFTLARATLSTQYKELYNLLSKLGLLKERASSYSVLSSNDALILNKAQSLASGLTISRNQFDSLKTMCGENNLVVAKVILAVFRRLQAASEFFAQGRMAFDKP